jgi:S1-C subfamily serine protease
MRALALLLVLLATALPGAAADWAAVIKQVERSLVFIETDESACTGFVINAEKRYVLTAAHCDGKSLWADSVKAEVIFKDTKKDLLVLEVKYLADRPALRLAAKNPSRGEEVMSAGFGYALERPFFRKANVQDDQLTIPEAGIGGPYVSTDAPFVAGQSGGPVVNLQGEVVAIVQRGDSGTTGIGVGAEIIRARTGRFWGP